MSLKRIGLKNGVPKYVTAGATYQWVDCDASNNPISSETNQSFTPTLNGNYACEVTLPGCDDLTACTVITTIGIEEMGVT